MVKLTADNVSEFEIDNDIFDDPFMEAATRAIERTKQIKSVGALIGPVAECWDRDTPKVSVVYNMYWLLVNAACYKKAELLREKFKMQHDEDLATHPYHGTIRRKK